MEVILDQQQIILQIKSNNQQVLKEIYTQNYKKVELFVLKNSGSSQQAKDIYQETFIAFWKNIKENKFAPANYSAIGGYIYQIAKNKWIDYLRSNSFKKTESLTSDSLLDSELEQTVDNEEQVQKMTLTLQAFKTIGIPCKKLLTRFYFQKFSMRKIAEELGMDEASVRNKKYRCIQKLRDIINFQ